MTSRTIIRNPLFRTIWKNPSIPKIPIHRRFPVQSNLSKIIQNKHVYVHKPIQVRYMGILNQISKQISPVDKEELKEILDNYESRDIFELSLKEKLDFIELYYEEDDTDEEEYQKFVDDTNYMGFVKTLESISSVDHDIFPEHVRDFYINNFKNIEQARTYLNDNKPEFNIYSIVGSGASHLTLNLFEKHIWQGLINDIRAKNDIEATFNKDNENDNNNEEDKTDDEEDKTDNEEDKTDEKKE